MLKACSHLTMALLLASSSITWSQQTSVRHTQGAAHTRGTVIAFLQMLAKPKTAPVPRPSPNPDGEGPVPTPPNPGPQPPEHPDPDPEPGPLPEPD